MLAKDITFANDTLVTVTKNNGATVTGTLFRVRDLSVTVVDPTTKVKTTVPLRHVASVDAVTTDADLFDGMSDDEALTTAALAALFDTSAKALRVELRRLGLGVGKGSTYVLTPATVRPLVADIRSGLVSRAS